MRLHTATTAARADGDWIALGASTVGTGHLARGLPCQDAHGGVVLEDGTLLLAVADGAGSAQFAEAGARLAVYAAIGYLAEVLQEGAPSDAQGWRGCLMGALEHAQAAIAQFSGDTEGTTAGDFATTLLVVVIEQETVASMQVGDGAVVLQCSRELQVLAPEATGQYINETTFITSDAAAGTALIRTHPLQEVEAVALFTDGVQFLAVEQATSAAHAPFFLPLFAYTQDEGADSEEIQAMLQSDRVNSRTDDDKTLVIAARRKAQR
ncbi:PP2C family serine/threonine-protein phosphatase [Acidipila sp. EB88]|uniref:PP2C family serine/threonine-protein phosphatase n=1 Tax=Acidipila sp. EB88 TaxID=2305226 RepID=UPI000F5E704C|nr:PP2C family serine/threonine-protein phosphatase [Acidipila sp. EB88]RRA47882.1 protein phosphatase 2C domain-containing protein [Acidipila sp. EB88]